MSTSRFAPKLLTVLAEGYDRQTFVQDLQAGITVGLVALPLAIAFAIASGVRPEQGLYTAIVAGFLISALGGSRVQIGGPTGAFVVLVYGIVAEHGYDGLATATVLAGLLLVVMGLSGLGSWIKFVPYPVTVGFTSGIAVLIATSQLRELLGLDLAATPPDVLGILHAVGTHLGTWSPEAVVVAVVCAAVVLLTPRITRTVPGPLAGLLVATAMVWGLELDVATVGSRFPPIPAGLPQLTLPSFDPALVRAVFPGAVAIAALGAIESLLSAVVADGMTGRRHRSDTELVAQGVANVVSPLVLGIPATGALARTATNVKSGGKTPVAGIVHAVTLLGVLLFLGNWAAYLPLPALAAILTIVAYNMSEWRRFLRLLRAPRADVAVLLVTFGVTVVVDLVAAIGMGMVLASMLFMQRMADVARLGFVTGGDGEENPDDPMDIRTRQIPRGVEVFEIEGPFFFGAADQFRAAIGEVAAAPAVLVLRLRHVPTIDATGLIALDDVIVRSQRAGTHVVLSGLLPEPCEALERAGILERVGVEGIAPDIDVALARAREVVERTAPL